MSDLPYIDAPTQPLPRPLPHPLLPQPHHAPGTPGYGMVYPPPAVARQPLPPASAPVFGAGAGLPPAMPVPWASRAGTPAWVSQLAGSSATPRQRAGRLQVVLGCCGGGRFYLGDARVACGQLGLTLFALTTAMPAAPLLGVGIVLATTTWGLIDGLRMLKDP